MDDSTASPFQAWRSLETHPEFGADALEARVWKDHHQEKVSDWIARETPVALVFNGISHAVMMASPGDLEDFALGTDSLGQVRRDPPAPVHPVRLTSTAVLRAESSLKSAQMLQKLTGATHAAAWCDLHGEVQLLREDVGRHNALDKLIGAMIRANIAVDQGFIAITSRASFEMVQKTAMIRAGALVAVSAPTSLAIQTAHECGVALAGLVRDGRRMVAYTFADRLGFAS